MHKIDILRPASREEWLTIRSGLVGASEAAAVLGVHPFVSPYELWAAKSGIVLADTTETSPMKRGRLLEKVAVEMIGETHPDWTLEANPIPGGRLWRDLDLRLCCTPDLLATDPGRSGFGNIQIKSVEYSRFRKDWRDEDGTTTPPLHAAVQAIVEAHLTGASWAAVAALVVGFGIELHLVPVPMHAGVIDRIRAEVATFWRRVADNEPPPPDFSRDGEIIAKLYPADDGEIIDMLDDSRIADLIDDMEQRKADEKEAADSLKGIKAEILSKLGTAAGARTRRGLLTAKTIHRKEFTVAASSYRRIALKQDREATT